MRERIAIIGAGMAGSTAARILADRRAQIVLFEKSGGTGGRLSTRRTAHGEYDHGAQYVTAKSDQFRALMTGLYNQGSVANWSPEGKDRDSLWHVGLPGMSGLVKPLLKGIDVRNRVRIAQIVRRAADITCIDEMGNAEAFDKVIVAIPSPQASVLLKPVDAVFNALDQIIYMPCWTSMFGFENVVETLPNLFRGEDHMVISWLTRNNTKPKRSGTESICAQAGAAWSQNNLEIDQNEAVTLMLAALEKMAGHRLNPVHAQAHRWRYARVEAPLGEPFLGDADNRILAIGDGMLGGRVEAAFTSARLLCDHLE